MLARFVPWGAREVEFRIEPPRIRQPLTGAQLAVRGLAGGAVGFAFGALLLACLEALKVMKDAPGTAFDLWTPLMTFGRPQDQGDWISLVGMLIFGLVCGLFTAAVSAARHGAGQELALDSAPEV